MNTLSDQSAARTFNQPCGRLPTVRVRRRWGRMRIAELERTIKDSPTIAVGPECAAEAIRCGQVFACVDGSPESEAVLSVVASLSSRPDVTGWLLNVAMPASRAEAVLLSESLHSNYLRRVVDRWRGRGVRLNWELLHGPDPARAILEHVGDRGVIVLTSHGASGREGGLGPVAAGVLAHASAPVIVLHA